MDLCAFITKWNDNLTGAYAAYTPLEEFVWEADKLIEGLEQ